MIFIILHSIICKLFWKAVHSFSVRPPSLLQASPAIVEVTLAPNLAAKPAMRDPPRWAGCVVGVLPHCNFYVRLQVARLVGSNKESLCGSWLYCKPGRNLLLRITLCHPLFPRRPSVPSPGEGYIHLQLPRCGCWGSSQDSHSRLVECWEFSVSGGQSPRAGPKPCRTARRMKECLQIT